MSVLGANSPLKNRLRTLSKTLLDAKKSNQTSSFRGGQLTSTISRVDAHNGEIIPAVRVFFGVFRRPRRDVVAQAECCE